MNSLTKVSLIKILLKTFGYKLLTNVFNSFEKELNILFFNKSRLIKSLVMF